MKNLVPFLVVVLLSFTQFSFAQESETQEGERQVDSVTVAVSAEEEQLALAAKIKQAEQEAKAAEKAEKKAEKAEKKAEKEAKKAEKAAKKLEDLKDDIKDKKTDILKRERKITDMTDDMASDKIKGKLSPNDIEKINGKIGFICY